MGAPTAQPRKKIPTILLALSVKPYIFLRSQCLNFQRIEPEASTSTNQYRKSAKGLLCTKRSKPRASCPTLLEGFLLHSVSLLVSSRTNNVTMANTQCLEIKSKMNDTHQKLEPSEAEYSLRQMPPTDLR